MKQTLILYFVTFNICLFNAQSIFQSSQEHKKFVMMISPDNTDEEIKNKIDFFKEELDVEVKVENIKRNSNKITALNFSYRDKKGNQGQSNLSGSQAIKGIQFSYEIDQDGQVNTNLITNKYTPLISKKNSVVSKEKFSSDDEFIKFFEKDSLDMTPNKGFSRVEKIIIDKDGNVRKSISENGEPIEDSIGEDNIFNFSGTDNIKEMMNKLKGQTFSFNFEPRSSDMLSLKDLQEQMKKMKEEIDLMRKEMTEQRNPSKKN